MTTALAGTTTGCGTILISGTAWLQHQEVNVLSNGTGSLGSCSGGSAGSGWQCVDLAYREYSLRDWGRVYAADNGGAVYIPEGSPDLTAYYQPSSYVPIPGDLIVENASASNAYGHVSVIDSVSFDSSGNGVINAVEQNTQYWDSGSGTWVDHPRHSYQRSGASISGAYSSQGVKAVMHSPRNVPPASTHPGTSEDAFPQGPVGRYPNNVLSVYAHDVSGNTFQIAEYSPGGSWWSNWSALHAGSYARGNLMSLDGFNGAQLLFYVGSDNQLWYGQPDVSNNWTWTALAAPAGQTFVGMPAVSMTTDLRYELWVRSSTNNMWHTWQPGPGQPWVQWSVADTGVTDDAVVVQDFAGRETYFAYHSDGVHTMHQITPGSSGWTAMSWLGGSASSGHPVVVRDGQGCLDLLVMNPDSNVYLNYELNPDAWTGWQLEAQAGAPPLVAVGSDGYARLLLKSINDGAWYERHNSSGGWSGWTSITPGGFSGGAAVVRTSFGQLQWFSVDGNGWMVREWENAPGSWSSLVSLGNAGSAWPPIGY